jgi:hypothetical protein
LQKAVLAKPAEDRAGTSLPAQKFQLADRDLLRDSLAANILLLNEATLSDFAT